MLGCLMEDAASTFHTVIAHVEFARPVLKSLGAYNVHGFLTHES